MTTLGDVIFPAGRRAGADVSLPVYSVTKHRGFVPSLEYFNKQVFAKDLSTYKRVSEGDFAFATIHLDEGSIGVAPEDALISPMYTIFATDKTRVDSSYLIRFLKAPATVARYAGLGRGTAERRKSISLAALNKLSVPLPPLPEQRRIASILDQADALRTKRRRALALLEQAADSVFIEMFGDVVANDRGWKSGVVSDLVARFTSGKSIVGTEDGEQNDRPRVLKISAVTSGEFLPTETKPLPLDYVPPLSHFVADGDLLISRANTAELVGATARVRGLTAPTVLPDKIWKFVWPQTPIATPTFVWKMFGRPEFRRAVSEIATGSSGSMKNISQSAVLALPTICPPLDLQSQFSSRIGALAEVTHRNQLQLSRFDELFASLQNRAFQGEL